MAGANVFILFDTSNYMYRGFVFAQDAIAEFVRSLDNPDRVAFYSYSRDLSRATTLTPDRNQVLRGVRTTVAGDDAALYNALLMTLKDAGQNTGRKVVVVFSNGPDNYSMVPPEDVAELAQSKGIPIYMISTREAKLEPVSSTVFKRMSAATGGEAYFAKTWREQQKAFASIRNDLAHLYSVSYYPQPNPNRGWRTITVKLKGERMKRYPHPDPQRLSAGKLARGGGAGGSATVSRAGFGNIELNRLTVCKRRPKSRRFLSTSRVLFDQTAEGCAVLRVGSSTRKSDIVVRFGNSLPALMHKTVILFLVLIGVSSTVAAAPAIPWTAGQANDWYSRQPWLVGSNFIPSTAINELEMWQADTFDLPTIDRELGWAQGLGMNTMRVFLHNLLWQQDSAGFLRRMEQFLQVADKHHIRIMFVLLDSVWDPYPKLGKQREPKPHRP